MKIKKRRLNEDAGKVEVDGISTDLPQNELAKEIADAAKKANGTDKEVLNKKQANQVAAEVKSIIKKITFDEVVVCGVKNKITRKLDKALRNNKRTRELGGREVSNVLICGLPGSGKTASVYDWVKSNDVHLTEINAKNNELEDYLNGITARSEEDRNKATKIYSDTLKSLEKPNSVLFIDEYNRQTSDQIRGSLLTLIQNHKVAGLEEDEETGEMRPGMKTFNNLLFTIAAINPALPSDKGAAPLNQAELSRFLIKVDEDSTKDATVEYLQKNFATKMASYNEESSLYSSAVEEALRMLDAGIFLVSDPNFEYDKRTDMRALADSDPDTGDATGKTMLNQRLITTALENNHGDLEGFLEDILTTGLLDRDKSMIETIMSKYKEPTFEKLCDKYGVDKTYLDFSGDPEEEIEEEDKDGYVKVNTEGKKKITQKTGPEVNKSFVDFAQNAGKN